MFHLEGETEDETTPKPFSLVGLLGDDFLNDPNCIPVYRESLLLDRNLRDIRNELKLCFARHYDLWKAKTFKEISATRDEDVKVLETEFEMKQTLNGER